MVTYLDFGGCIAPLEEPPSVLALGALNLLQDKEDRYYTSEEIAQETRALAKYGKPLTAEQVTQTLELVTDKLEIQETSSGLVFKIKSLL